MDELIDIVNKKDEVISKNLKTVAHSDILIHRTVHWVVVNKDNQIFLVKRSLNREKGAWLFDASIWWHVLSWETYMEAIIREGEEELGIKNWKYIFVCKYFSDHPRMKHICSVFIINFLWNIKLDPREFDSWEWIDYRDIISFPSECFTPDYLITLDSIRNFFNS